MTQKWRLNWGCSRTYGSFLLCYKVILITLAHHPAGNDFRPPKATLHYVLSKQILQFWNLQAFYKRPDIHTKYHHWSQRGFQLWYQYFILSNHSLLSHYYQSHRPSFHSQYFSWYVDYRAFVLQNHVTVPLEHILGRRAAITLNTCSCVSL